jgi:hypothetical protein
MRVFKIGKKDDGSGNIGVLGTMDFPKVIFTPLVCIGFARFYHFITIKKQAY